MARRRGSAQPGHVSRNSLPPFAASRPLHMSAHAPSSLFVAAHSLPRWASNPSFCGALGALLEPGLMVPRRPTFVLVWLVSRSSS
jgi:hypothetical protein